MKIEIIKKIVLIVALLIFSLPWLVVLANAVFRFADMEYLVSIVCAGALAGISLFIATLIIFEIIEN
ncbi:hypothetical protein ACH45_07630 [Ligilactobacillus animalis]|nr:hypothetical protein ACH45_07630 [Ligilactobacillus animalis]THE21398.1 hypothetical protein ACH44_04200 [Ligilactobacillus animalis]